MNLQDFHEVGAPPGREGGGVANTIHVKISPKTEN